MTVTDAQVRIMMRERQKGKSQEQAAARANVRSRKTVAKYERLGQLPSERKQSRTYRTRPDAFAEEWSQLEAMLVAAPELEAKTLFGWLCEQQPGKYREGQLRTLQRRVSEWRALHQEQIAILEQVHRPGEVLQTDGVWLTELNVTLQGELFPHILIHSVLPYSNWEWGCVAQSESLAALGTGLGATLTQLGAVPRYHQTDNSSAATRRLGQAEQDETGRHRGYTEGYLALLDHYGLEPRTIHRQSPQENGDVESSHGGFKRALHQHLLLHGSRDFATLDDYTRFLEGVLDKRNQTRQQRLAEELSVMAPLTIPALRMTTQVRVRVSKGSLIRIAHNHYSVPTSLIGRMVRVYLHEWHLDVYYGQKLVITLPRLMEQNRQHINYRHIIESLLRKPGGFRDYRYQDALFPQRVFRQAWEHLNLRLSSRKADLVYLRILRLAARTLESEVATALQLLLESAEVWDETHVEQLLNLHPPPVPQIQRGEICLDQYDQLLEEVGYGAR